MMHGRDWMYKRLNGNYLSEKFVEGVDRFVKFATEQENYKESLKMKCPCTKCKLVPFKDVDTVRLHLYKHGFHPNYYCWSCHGEQYADIGEGGVGSSSSRSESNPYTEMIMDAFGPQFGSFNEEIVNNLEEEPFPEAKTFFDMLSNAQKPLYEGCQQSLLSVAARVTNLKCEYNIPHRAIDGITSLIRDICPEDNKMAETFYGTKKLLKGLELPHEKIDVCPNGCMLFWKDQSHLEKCGICKEDRFRKRGKGKNIAKSQLIRFPITDRLQRLYATKNTSMHMRWHVENRRKKDIMAHPCDGEAWRHFDTTYPDFAAEPRNVRLGLCTDGFAPFGNFGKNYSCWPVILTPYNLPPWLCLKRQFLFLGLIIPGPKSPKGNLDVYLQPLVEELKQLWEVGALTYDVSKKQNFNMRAALLWTISDFPAYGMLSGWSTAGKLACPYCMENTKSFTLKHGRKQTWFDCHRQFLPKDHVFRKNKNGFSKNKEDHSLPPPRLCGDELYERVSHLPKTTDNCDCPRSKVHNWTKQSTFWELPYWRDLLIRHNLDVMHIEKNFFEQLIHTIMNVKGKTKDDKEARKDLAKHCKRPRLHLHEGSRGDEMPNASFVLSKEKRKVLCEWIKQLKFPDGYVSNLSRCVNLQEGKLFGMKSHDCHVFMERLLPIALKELLPLNVWKPITEISQFFRDLSSSLLKLEDVIRLEKNIPEILCKLERIFPPAFFNVMEHLPVHLPYEAKVGGPVQYRWMYPFERFLHHLKRKIGNKARVEGSICNAYLTEEISNFCTQYFEPNIDTKARDMGRNVHEGDEGQIDPNIPEIFSSNIGHATTKGQQKFLDDLDYRAAHGYILSNCELLRDYERLFEAEMAKKYPRISANDVWRKFEHLFSEWFKKYVLSHNIDHSMIRTLAVGPSRAVQKYHHYYINGYNFHTYTYGKDKSTMNYGVCVKSHEEVNYYGILEEVIELMYVGPTQCYRAILFKCDWFDSGNGTNVHPHYKLVEVNHTKRYPKYDPFVLAYQVQQVYFAPYPSIKRDKDQWWAVFQIKGRSMVDAPEDQIAFQEDINENPPQLSEPNEDNVHHTHMNDDQEDHVSDDDDILDANDEEGDEFISETSTDEDIDNEYETDSSTASEDLDCHSE